ncbi:Aste57867_25177 [Aphanomyces stellatus]|uniref:Aste57867_25177 protein n=1 Tax=Aphanomyces stellatus TaxID=120398 RepID=A0A485LSL0_9STRA|nr:hypothetical protein As57867_025099 [Aphanomyces stellatus]VFU01806.1 Aste57867_25177 [Aphanomyces stellatus]
MWDSPVLKQVILGCYDPTSPLACLRGQHDVLALILKTVLAMWKAHVDKSNRGFMHCRNRKGSPFPAIRGRLPKPVQFPPPWFDDPMETFHVNMMPFIMGSLDSLPPSCHRYHDMILCCLQTNKSHERGKVGYLTIHESMVEAGTTQRRAGLHIEAGRGGGKQARVQVFQHHDFRWGGGYQVQHHLFGGIYMASTVGQSCGVYDAVVVNPETVAGPLGNVEHLRMVLDKDERISYMRPGANHLYWITDRTPHEALPAVTTQFRQYFRLVTSNVSHWFADHSTANPLGVQPTATIVVGNKFHHPQDEAMAPQMTCRET